MDLMILGLGVLSLVGFGLVGCCVCFCLVVLVLGWVSVSEFFFVEMGLWWGDLVGCVCVVLVVYTVVFVWYYIIVGLIGFGCGCCFMWFVVFVGWAWRMGGLVRCDLGVWFGCYLFLCFEIVRFDLI